MIPTKQMRVVILKHHGGLESATDAQISTLWNALAPEVQADYLSELTPAIPMPKKEKAEVSDAGH